MNNTKFNVLFDNGLPAKEIWQAKRYQIVKNAESGENFIKVVLEEDDICHYIKDFVLNKKIPRVFFLEDSSECWFDMEMCYLIIRNIPKELLKESRSMPVKIVLYDNKGNFIISFE